MLLCASLDAQGWPGGWRLIFGAEWFLSAKKA
jgi:hypothetical protein